MLVTQSCPTLCNPTDCSLPGSSVHGILQAGIPERVAISFSSIVGRNVKWCSQLWKTVWRFFKKLKIDLPSDLAIPLLSIYPKVKAET